MMTRLVVIGAGMASGRMLEHLFETRPNTFDVTLFNAEPRGNYNRIMLSPILSGEKTYDEIITHDADWYAEHGVDCRFGEPVKAIDRDRKVVVTDQGETPYDKLVIATGSTPITIPVAGNDLPGVINYRDLDDTNAMITATSIRGGKAVVIGGGLLGLEAAAGLRRRGMDVKVLHLMGHLMERQLDPTAGALLQADLEKRGITVQTEACTQEIVGVSKVEAVRLTDGTEYPADLVCMAVGIRPAVKLAQDNDLMCGRGIQVDDRMVTSDPDIVAVGECVEHRGNVYGLVAPLYEMAKVAADTLAGIGAKYAGSEVSTKLKVTGVDLFSAGDFADSPGREEIVFRDITRGIYRRLVIRSGKLVGAVMYGDVSDGHWFFEHIRSATDISDLGDLLIFGPGFAEVTSLDPMVAAAASRGDLVHPCCSGHGAPFADLSAA